MELHLQVHLPVSSLGALFIYHASVLPSLFLASWDAIGITMVGGISSEI